MKAKLYKSPKDRSWSPVAPGLSWSTTLIFYTYLICLNRNEHSSDSTENTSISNSPVKVDELPGLDESYSHSNSDEHCDYSNADNGLTHADSDDDVYNDDVNDQDEQYSDSEEEQAAMFNSDEINGDGECGILIDSTRTGSR